MSLSGDGSFQILPTVIRLDENALENIRFFRRQWDFYARITGIDELSEGTKISVMFSVMGGAASSLANNLLRQRVARNLNVDAILWALENHFLPFDNLVFDEKYVFNDEVVQDEIILLSNCASAHQPISESSVWPQPSCPPEELVLANENYSSSAVRSPSYHWSFPSFEVGSYIVLRSDLEVKSEPSIWRVCDALYVQKFVPHTTEEGCRVYMNHEIYFVPHTDWTWRLTRQDYFEVGFIKETTEHVVSGYKVMTVHLRHDVFELAKTEIKRSSVPTDGRQKENDAEKECLIQRGNTSQTKLCYYEPENGDRGSANSFKNEIATFQPKSNVSKSKKNRVGEIGTRKRSRQRKIRDRICLGFIGLMCCCCW